MSNQLRITHKSPMGWIQKNIVYIAIANIIRTPLTGNDYTSANGIIVPGRTGERMHDIRAFSN